MKLVKSQEVEVMVSFRGRKIAKTEIKYTYQSDDGAILTFMANPKKAWTWDTFANESNELGLKNANAIINLHLDSLLETI